MSDRSNSPGPRRENENARPGLLFLVTEDWYFCSHRMPIARAARDAGYHVMVATRVRDHGAAIEAEGFELIPLAWRRSSGPVRQLPELIEVIRLYRARRPGIVHHVALKPVVFGAIAARLAGQRLCVSAVAGLGFVFTSGSLKARLLKPLMARTLAALLSRPGQQIIVQNEDDRRMLESIGLEGGRIAVIRGSGVDTDRFTPTPEPDGAVTATMVSRMLWDKGVGVFAEAARLLSARSSGIRMRLVGSPDPDNPAAVPVAQLERWQASGVLSWSPHRADIPRVWRDSHIGVLPSHYGEGVPLSLLEAAACARALVATDAPGCREIAVAGETALTVPLRDPLALADAIERLAGDGALRRRLGAAARLRVESCFSERLVVEQTLDIYRAMTADGGPLAQSSMVHP